MMGIFLWYHMFKSSEFREDFTGNLITSHRSLMAMRKCVTEMLEPWVTPPFSCLSTKKRKLLLFTWNVPSDRKCIIILPLLKSISCNFSIIRGCQVVLGIYFAISRNSVFYCIFNLIKFGDDSWPHVLLLVNDTIFYNEFKVLVSVDADFESGEVIDSF